MCFWLLSVAGSLWGLVIIAWKDSAPFGRGVAWDQPSEGVFPRQPHLTISLLGSPLGGRPFRWDNVIRLAEVAWWLSLLWRAQGTRIRQVGHLKYQCLTQTDNISAMWYSISKIAFCRLRGCQILRRCRTDSMLNSRLIFVSSDVRWFRAREFCYVFRRSLWRLAKSSINVSTTAKVLWHIISRFVQSNYENAFLHFNESP